MGQPPTRGTTKRHSDMPLNLSEPMASPRMCPHDLREPLDEDPALAKRVVAAETPNSHRNRHGPALPWEISKPAIVSTVDTV
jgi:hypothetical protein